MRSAEFAEVFVTSDNRAIPCLSYDIETAPTYTQFGFDSGVSFYLSCKKDDYTPKKDDKITYKGVVYKVESYNLDAFGICYKIFLKSLSSK